MSTKSAPFFWIECDAEGCDWRCPGSDNEDCIAYVTASQAKDVAECSDWWLDYKGTGKDYCPEHKPAGCDCDLMEKPDSQPPCAGFRRNESSLMGFCSFCGHLEECHA